MAGPLLQHFLVGLYVLKKTVTGQKRYPLAMMLEPLFRCNLACPGCGKIDYPDEILNQRLSVEECLHAADECEAPVICLPGGEPLIHKEIDEIVAGLVKRRKFVYLCTNALLLKKKHHLFKPSPYFAFAVHLDGFKDHHDKWVAQEGVFDKAVEAIKEVVARGFRVNVNCTLFNDANPEEVAKFFDFVKSIGVESITLSPGYAYERAPAQESFLNRQTTKNLFRDIFRLGRGRGWVFNQSPLFLDFLAGNQTYKCTPWANPTRNIFGWQKPCYLIGEGYAETFEELMTATEWDKYGTGNYEKCADCMMNTGYEGSAVADAAARPWKAIKALIQGPRTEGPMAPEISLENQRQAEKLHEKQVKQLLTVVQAKQCTANREANMPEINIKLAGSKENSRQVA